MKIYYRPPKVKPSKNKNKALPGWNDSINNLDKYKLSSSEVLKKKINSISKNLEKAKKDLNDDNIEKKELSKEVTESSEKKRKISTNVLKIRETSNRNTKHKNTISNNHSSSFNNHIFKKNSNNEEVIFSNPLMIKINSTKVERIIEKPAQRELPDVSKTLQEFELIDKIRILEENLHKRNINSENNLYNRNKNIISSDNNNTGINFITKGDSGDITDFNEDLKNKFDNLSDIDNSMKKLNDILDYSSKSHLKFKFDIENVYDKHDIEDENKKIYIKKNDDDNYLKNFRDSNFNIMYDFNENSNRNLNYNELSEPTPYKNISSTPLLSQKSSKTVEIKRNVIDIDIKQNKEEYMDSKELDELEFIKKLLFKTQSELEKLGSRFELEEESKFN